MKSTELLENPDATSLESPQRGDRVTLQCGDTECIYNIQVVIATTDDENYMGYIDTISDGNNSSSFLSGGDIVDSLLGDEITFTKSNVYKIDKTNL